jgi:hypothetical protein
MGKSENEEGETLRSALDFRERVMDAANFSLQSKMRKIVGEFFAFLRL